MTDEELERMRAYAQATAGEPHQRIMGYAAEYAQDVPRLLAALDVCRANAKQWANLAAARLENARDGTTRAESLWHRLRFAEMVLDRLNAEVDGVPWREAARLSESLDGEPGTAPLAPASGPGVQSTD